MSKFKRILSLVLCAALLLSAAPLAGFIGLELPHFSALFAPKAQAATYGVLEYTVSNGAVTITGCDSSATGALEIPTKINGYPVTGIGNGAFEGCAGLTSVMIPDSVASIGNYAFEDCTGLGAVYITDLKKWCNISFFGRETNPLFYAHNLYLNGELIVDLIIPGGTTHISERAFCGCTSFTSVTIPSSVTSIGAGEQPQIIRTAQKNLSMTHN